MSRLELVWPRTQISGLETIAGSWMSLEMGYVVGQEVALPAEEQSELETVPSLGVTVRTSASATQGRLAAVLRDDWRVISRPLHPSLAARAELEPQMR